MAAGYGSDPSSCPIPPPFSLFSLLPSVFLLPLFPPPLPLGCLSSSLLLPFGSPFRFPSESGILGMSDLRLGLYF